MIIEGTLSSSGRKNTPEFIELREREWPQLLYDRARHLRSIAPKTTASSRFRPLLRVFWIFTLSISVHPCPAYRSAC